MTDLSTTRSEALFSEAQHLMPGGVVHHRGLVRVRRDGRYTHSYGVASAVKMSATSIAMSHHWTKRDVRGSIA